MNWLRRLLARRRQSDRLIVRYQPDPPPGFVRRSDPNFYWLARKF